MTATEGYGLAMPIWSELLVLMLVAYAVGLGIGWAVWGSMTGESENDG